MSVASYITALQEERQLSYMQLAKEIGITYQNMMDLKNGRIAFFSDKVLTKLSLYENKDKADIIYQSIDKDIYDESSQCSLKYLCQYMADGYSVTFRPNFPDPFKIGVMYFDGLISKKRTVNNYTAVDSWETLKIEHMKQYKNIEYSRDAYVDLFINEDMYINSVMNYAISRIDLLHDENIRSYTIIVGNNVKYDLPYIENLIPSRTKLKINIVEE
ncbi:MAG: hypothetical protein LUG12_03455 [Erysipelotrichaceae bacterium]|nr:hypothetical protein [Erysipelotrichaceae bacterium]